MIQVLFVCTGNTCRSPMAEGLLRKRLAERGREDIGVGSAGIGAGGGHPAADGAYLVALEDGVDLSSHRSRRLTPEMIESADVVLAMSREHAAVVDAMNPGDKAWLLGEYVGRSGDRAEVADPYGGDLETYREAWTELSALVEELLDRLDREWPRDPDNDRG
ncbi:MAG: low molecular weight protein arginine phosphatase [Gemmatimonadales bacterium]